VVALSEITYKGKVVRGSKQNTINYVWKLVVNLFSSLRIKIQGTYLVGILPVLRFIRPRNRGSILVKGERFSFKTCAPVRASTPKSYTKSTSRYFPGAKAVRGEKDYSHASNAEVKNARTYTSASLIYLHFVHRENFTVAGNTLVIYTICRAEQLQLKIKFPGTHTVH
jgi:hypothetical protein